MNKGFNFLQNEIINTNKNIVLDFNNIKKDIKDIRKEIHQNSFYINNQINNLKIYKIDNLEK